MSVGIEMGTHRMGAGKVNPYRVPNNSHTSIKSQIDCVCFLAGSKMQESFDLLGILFQVIPAVATLFYVVHYQF